jgi:phage repressor protein C with HTH and peptisase S24 domain
MISTLLDGDLVLVDLAVIDATPRDGIHAPRMGETLHIRRIAAHFRNDHIWLLSDNPMYPTWHDVDRQSVDIVG